MQCALTIATITNVHWLDCGSLQVATNCSSEHHVCWKAWMCDHIPHFVSGCHSLMVTSCITAMLWHNSLLAIQINCLFCPLLCLQCILTRLAWLVKEPQTQQERNTWVCGSLTAYRSLFQTCNIRHMRLLEHDSFYFRILNVFGQLTQFYLCEVQDEAVNYNDWKE